MIENIDPNPDNFVSVGILNTKATLVGCLLRLEPNKDKKVRSVIRVYLFVAIVVTQSGRR